MTAYPAASWTEKHEILVYPLFDVDSISEKIQKRRAKTPVYENGFTK